MQAGRLDRFITLQRSTTILSESGDRSEEWATIGTARRPASMTPASGTEGFTAPQTVALELTEFRIRYSSDVSGVTPLERIVYPALTNAEVATPTEISSARIYDVIAIHEIGRREGLKIIASRRPDTAGAGTVTTSGSLELLENDSFELREETA